MDPLAKYKPARLFYDSYTPEDCDASLPPVIFVHGLCGLQTSWSKVWKRIADQTRRKAFTIELRNHGKSEWNDIFALDALARDIENFAKENDFKQICLVGHSLGGKASLRLAMLRPELVDRFIAEEVSVRDPSQEEINTFVTMQNIARKMIPFFKTMNEKQIRKLLSNHAAAFFPEWGVGDSAYNVPLRKKSDGSIGFDFNFDVIDKCIADGSLVKIDAKTCIEFSGPALFLFCKGSPLKIEEDTMLKKFFPNAKLQEFSRHAHVLHLECSDEYVENCSLFINH